MALYANISVTGNCTTGQLGAAKIIPSSGTPPYTVEWVTPNLGEDQLVLESTRENLTYGTYSIRINDSTIPINEEIYVNVPISSGICVSILSVIPTTCQFENGAVTGTSTSYFSSTNFYLFTSNDIFVTSSTTSTSTAEFTNLSAGTYYLVAQDPGGCTGKSQNFIVEPSNTFDCGLYVVPNSACGGTPIGKIFVTGQTGVAPYTYFWNGGQTGSTLTGLTAGQYSVQVTDSKGCSVTKTGQVVDVPPLGFGIFTATPPTCFATDGAVSLTVTGGTAPYYYSASTGNVAISYSQTYTLTGLSAGQYNFLVTDAGLCTINVGTTLSTPQGISSVNITSQNSYCSSNNGQIIVDTVGGNVPITYTLIYPDASVVSVTNSQTSYLFNNLQSGTYTVTVQDSLSCIYMQEVIINATNKFTISTTATPTTCNQNNGTINVVCTTGYTSPLDYSLDGLVKVIDTALSALTFSNVTSGQHTITVTDADGCVQTTQVYVPPSPQLNFSLYTTSCGTGNNGTITAFITSGTPPYTFKWSDNVVGNPQQITVSGLTAGTYSLAVVDSDGCSLSRNTLISCDSNYVSYQTYVMGQEVFNIQSPSKFGLIQMLNEGYHDITSGNTNCKMISATFTAKVSVIPQGTIASQSFYTSTSLVDAPSDNLWYNTLKGLLLSIPGVGNVTIDQLNNQITIQTSTSNNSLQGQEIKVELVIVYDIMCLT